MSMKINPNTCQSCGICSDICKNDAVYYEHKSTGYAPAHINPDKCINCGACVDECPANAISEEK